MKSNKIIFILLILSLLYTGCADKEKYETLGPGFYGNSMYEFTVVWGKDYQDEVGPGHGDGSFTSEPGGFKIPRGIEARFNRIYVADAGNDRVEIFNTEGNLIYYFEASSNVTMYDICVDSSTNIYVVDRYAGKVVVYNKKGDFLKSITYSGMLEPVYIDIDENDTLYITERLNKKIIIIGSVTNDFGIPEGITLSGIGVYENRLYISDRDKAVIYVYTTSGVRVKTISVFGFREEDICKPGDIEVDKDGNLIFIDGDKVKIFTRDGGYITAFGQPGRAYGEFNSPEGITSDSAGNIYVSDTENNRVQKFEKK